MEVGNNWYFHAPADVLRGKKVEIIYDQIITTTRPVGANRPDIIIKDMNVKKAFIIDVACPVDCKRFAYLHKKDPTRRLKTALSSSNNIILL